MCMVTVKQWKELNMFEPIRDGIFDVDGTVRHVAACSGKTIDEVEEMPVSDLLPEFLRCLQEINKEVFAKMPKNGSGDSRE